MSNPNNLLRPPLLNPNQAGANANQQASPMNGQINLDELRTLITNIASSVLRQEGPQVVQQTLNADANSANITDQTIDERHRDNLTDFDKIPDVVKCLKEFSGQPGEFNSWRKSVDRIISIYESTKGTPKYYGILSTIRNKIVGNADIALESYNTPLDWSAMVKCLTMHYADKRDLSTLEYQMSTLVQGNKSTPEFYQQVYSYLSLILNKIGCREMTNDSLHMMTQTYRDKALDTFIRGLNGDMPRLLGIKEPVDLPQALHLCQKLENQNFRTNHVLNTRRQQPPQIPRGNFVQPQGQQFYPQLAYLPQTNRQPWQPRQQQYNSGQHYRQNLPPRPPKPQQRPEPMDVDHSMHSRRVNYMNRPFQNPNNFTLKRQQPQQTNHPQGKYQRTFYINTANEINPDYLPSGDYGNFENYGATNYDQHDIPNDNCDQYLTNVDCDQDSEHREFMEPTDIHFLA